MSGSIITNNSVCEITAELGTRNERKETGGGCLGEYEKKWQEQVNGDVVVIIIRKNGYNDNSNNNRCLQSL